MGRTPPQNPLDTPLAEAVADTIAADLIEGKVHVLDRRELARRAAMEGFRQGLASEEKIVGEMAADHEQASEEEKAAVLREAAEQIRTLPSDLP